MRVAIGNKGQSNPCSSFSLWRVTVSQPFSPQQQPAIGYLHDTWSVGPGGPASSLLPGTDFPGRGVGSVPPLEASGTLQSSLLAFCLSLRQAPWPPPNTHTLYTVDFTYPLPSLPHLSLHCCWTQVSSVPPTEDKLAIHTCYVRSAQCGHTFVLIATFEKSGDWALHLDFWPFVQRCNTTALSSGSFTCRLLDGLVPVTTSPRLRSGSWLVTIPILFSSYPGLALPFFWPFWPLYRSEWAASALQF